PKRKPSKNLIAATSQAQDRTQDLSALRVDPKQFQGQPIGALPIARRPDLTERLAPGPAIGRHQYPAEVAPGAHFRHAPFLLEPRLASLVATFSGFFLPRTVQHATRSRLLS